MLPNQLGKPKTDLLGLLTVHSKFKAVLTALLKLAKDIIRPKDPLFTTVHKKLLSPQYTPYLDNCIGAIDGTNI